MTTPKAPSGHVQLRYVDDPTGETEGEGQGVVVVFDSQNALAGHAAQTLSELDVYALSSKWPGLHSVTDPQSGEAKEAAKVCTAQPAHEALPLDALYCPG